MLYSFLRVLVGFTLRVFFRKIYIIGTEHVHASKPQLIASNHPSGFLEPLIMACFFPKPLHFLVRGDVFDNPFLKPLLRGTNQIPVFRFRDGFSRLRENSQSIDESLEVLKNKNNLLIFAEGNTQSIKKLRPLQKGISRIAFQLQEEIPDSELEILPVGINFSQFISFDEVVMLRIGHPIKVKDYMDIYNRDKNAGHHKILEDVYAAMKKNVVHLDQQERIHVFEKLRLLQGISDDEKYLPVHSASSKLLDAEILLASKTDSLNDEKLSEIKKDLHHLEIKMKTIGLSFADLSKKPFDILSFVFLLIGFLPAAIGFLFHFLPMAGGYLFMKTKVKQLEFKSSILMVSVLLLILIYYIMWIVFTVWLGFPIYIFITGFVSGLWLRYWYRQLKLFSWTSREKFAMIRDESNTILNKL